MAPQHASTIAAKMPVLSLPTLQKNREGLSSSAASVMTCKTLRTVKDPGSYPAGTQLIVPGQHRQAQLQYQAMNLCDGMLQGHWHGYPGHMQQRTHSQ